MEATKQTQKKNSKDLNDLIECEVQFGNQCNHLLDQALPRTFGYCYQCHYSGHTVKFCPLSYCTSCNAWGHIFRVCPVRKKKELELIAKIEKNDGHQSSINPLPPVPSCFTK